jgi:hypothetical protein
LVIRKSEFVHDGAGSSHCGQASVVHPHQQQSFPDRFVFCAGIGVGNAFQSPSGVDSLVINGSAFNIDSTNKGAGIGGGNGADLVFPLC